MQFSNSHARTFIRLNSVVYIFFSFTRNFVLSVEFPPKRPEKESWNSLEFFHDGIRRRHYGSQMISLSKNSSSFFLQSSMKEIQPRQVFILKVLVIAPNFKASSIFQFLHRLHVWQPHDPMLVKTFHFHEKRRYHPPFLSFCLFLKRGNFLLFASFGHWGCTFTLRLNSHCD